ncbi:MAG: ElyC/SanA/YdcF family protein [bacterium]
MTTIIPLIIYGGDTLQDGTQCGPETKRRCRHAIRFLQRHPDQQFIIILAAGKRPDKPEYPPLKEVMKKFLTMELHRAHNFFPHTPLPPIIIARQEGWGTFHESLAAANVMQRTVAKQAYVCSSWYHIPRILFIWNLISGWKVWIVPTAALSPRFDSIFRECAAFLKVMRTWYLWRRTRTE